MTPGTYVRLRRESTGRSLADVALLLDTAPHVPAPQRVDWLAAIEADRAPISEQSAYALAEVLPIDLLVLSRLQAIATGTVEVDAPRLCSHCGAGSAPTGLDQLHDLSDIVFSVSMRAMLRQCGLSRDVEGIAIAVREARKKGWVLGADSRFRRAALIADPRT